MTRFARSNGSKGSNARVPETGTSWEVMKKQLEISQREAKESGDRKKAEEQRIQNYEQFLKEERSNNSTRSWCEFPAKELDAVIKIKPHMKKNKKKQKSSERSDAYLTETSESTECRQGKKKKIVKGTSESNLNNEKLNVSCENNSIKHKKIKKEEIEVESKEIIFEFNSEHTKNNKKRKITQIQPPAANKLNDTTAKKPKVGNDISSNKNKNKFKKKHLQNVALHEMNQVVTDEIKGENNNIGMKINKKSRQTIKIIKKKVKVAKRIEGDESAEMRSQVVKFKNRNQNKNADNSSLTRRKPSEERSFTLMVGGEELKVTRFDGFPVLAKDAHRLNELKHAMKSKGIPKSEVFRTMKLERRRAEKNLSRMKKVVCFNCRKGGHLLAECPEIGNTDGGMPMTGLCFKCGSTEHKSYECKVQKNDDFKFSKCFICKEQGHIARQCPDHPKGLFPNGGACKLCGDVTHFKKDCPTLLNDEEDNKVTLDTLEQFGNLEEIETKPIIETRPQKKAKLIKF